MNFQRKHGKKVPLPKFYVDENSSDSEGLKLQDGSRVGRKATGGGSGRDRKCSHNNNNPDDDPNKHRKTDPFSKPPRHPMARKEKQKGQPGTSLHVTPQGEDPAGILYA